MQFYDSSNKQGIAQEIDRLCDTTDTSYSRVDKTSRVNTALEELVGDIINADGTWQYDDTNHTDLPVGTATLVDEREAYSFASEYLQVEQISVKDADGRWHVLEPIDFTELEDIAIEEYFEDKGMPTHYDILGDTIRLYPSPDSNDVTLASGLKVRFKRTASLFTVASDTSADTQEPGLPSTHHVMLAYMAAIPYCMTYKKDRVSLYQKKVDEMKKSLLAHYSFRHRRERKVMSTAPIRFR